MVAFHHHQFVGFPVILDFHLSVRLDVRVVVAVVFQIIRMEPVGMDALQVVALLFGLGSGVGRHGDQPGNPVLPDFPIFL